MNRQDPYASATQSATVIKPGTRSAAEKQLDSAMDAAWANEQGNDRAEYFGILRRVTIDLIEQQSARIAELAAQLAAPRGTDAQILKERQLTAYAIDGAMALGYQGAEPPPDDSAWLRPFYEMGRLAAERDAQLEAVGAGGVSRLIGAEPAQPLARRAIGDAIRAAYDLGYNDRAMSRREYDGLQVEVDHAGALIHRLGQLAARRPAAQPAPERQPLTDAEITALYFDALGAQRIQDTSLITRIVRAVERHHGIQGASHD